MKSKLLTMILALAALAGCTDSCVKGMCVQACENRTAGSDLSDCVDACAKLEAHD